MQRSMGCFSAQDDAVLSTLDSSTYPAEMVFFKMPVNLFSQVMIMDRASVPVR